MDRASVGGVRYHAVTHRLLGMNARLVVGSSTTRSRPLCHLQVGLIASLRNEHQHRIVEQALTALGCMEHRGACSADDISGDGAGVMTKLPWKLFKAEMPQLNEEVTG